MNLFPNNFFFIDIESIKNVLLEQTKRIRAGKN